MRLIQIPFSHNCIKVRRALELKGLAFETVDIAPMEREPVAAVSGQRLVPVLEDRGRAIADSTAILRHLEAAYPERPLEPRDPAQRAECWLLEDWADQAFMAASRRLAYWMTVHTPGAIENLFFPRARGLRRRLLGQLARRVVRRRFRLSAERERRDEREVPVLAALAVERLGERPFLVGERLSVADVALAAMTLPLWRATPAVRDDAAVQRLLTWGTTVMDPAVVSRYRPSA